MQILPKDFSSIGKDSVILFVIMFKIYRYSIVNDINNRLM